MSTPLTGPLGGAAITQIPFLPLVEHIPTEAQVGLFSAIARITPFLIPSSLFAATLPFLPATAEYYILQDEEDLSIDKVVAFLDGGARRFISNNLSLIGQVPADRLILRLKAEDTSALENLSIISGVSAVFLETASLAETFLKPLRLALNAAGGRQRELFIYSTRPANEVVLHLPASLKIMTKTVAGTAVIPIPYLSTNLANLSSPQPEYEKNKLSVTTLFTSCLRSDRKDGLFPTVPVSTSSIPSPLGLVYSSALSITQSIITGNAVYFSRSRQALWRKGETSGAMQAVERIRMDCDADALEFRVVETGPNGVKEGFCHIPDQVSCFGGTAGLGELETTLRSRLESAPEGSYTARLFSEPALVKAKIMEEAAELCEATTKKDIADEAADLIYFAMVKCVAAGVGFKEIGSVLDHRSLKVTRRKGDAKKEWVEKLGLTPEQAVGLAATPLATPPPPPPAAQPSFDADIRCLKYDLATVTPSERAQLLKRPLMSSSDMISRVTPIIDTVRTGGDAGLRSLVVKFDRCAPAEDSSFPLVLKAPFAPQSMVLDPVVKSAIDQAYSNIRQFHQAQMDKEKATLIVETMPGVVCSRFARPIERVGIYVPGGTAILPSTALMLAVPAQVAHCSAVTLATPPRPDGSISPEIVYIASISGVGSIVRAGGAQAVAAMAYGTETVPKVDKIFGPGNQFVTAAKMAVSMDSGSATAIDMPAGPSEVLVCHFLCSFFFLIQAIDVCIFSQVIADSTCVPAFVASDLLAQAEHGTDSQVVLLSVNLPASTLAEIDNEIHSQALALSRVDIIRKSISLSLIIQCADIAEAMGFSNAYAPEHLILHTANASGLLDEVKHAGSVFVGPYSPERFVFSRFALSQMGKQR